MRTIRGSLAGQFPWGEVLHIPPLSMQQQLRSFLCGGRNPRILAPTVSSCAGSPRGKARTGTELTFTWLLSRAGFPCALSSSLFTWLLTARLGASRSCINSTRTGYRAYARFPTQLRPFPNAETQPGWQQCLLFGRAFGVWLWKFRSRTRKDAAVAVA